MRALIESKPEYRRVRILRLDWDTYRDDPIVRELRIPRRSTLVMFARGREIGRVVARTRAADIEPLFEAAISGEGSSP